MTQPFEDLLARFPQRLEPEFVMSFPNEPIYLATGNFDLSRDGQLLGHIEGDIVLEWLPKLQILCRGGAYISRVELLRDHSLVLHAPQLGLTAEAFVTTFTRGQPQELQALLLSTDNPRLQSAERALFYLVNFPFFLGEPVQTGSGPFTGSSLDRMRMTAGSLVCTIDRIRREGHFDRNKNEPGYLLTHVGEIKRADQPINPSELTAILDALYWLFTFMRGAKTGPILPSVEFPYAKHWISVAPWTVDEPRRVDSWMPDRSPIDANNLFESFIGKWSDPTWNEALRTTISWYVASNSPSATNEAKITLCQIALEVLASLQGLTQEAAHSRIRSLLQRLNIPTQVPSRLQALDSYANDLRVDAPECITRIRNKFEHPTTENRLKAGTIDGITRMQAAQYGLELFELCLLAMMNYRGKYARRAFQGWKGDDEIPVPWA